MPGPSKFEALAHQPGNPKMRILCACGIHFSSGQRVNQRNLQPPEDGNPAQPPHTTNPIFINVLLLTNLGPYSIIVNQTNGAKLPKMECELLTHHMQVS
jgi:hypothetical protein